MKTPTLDQQFLSHLSQEQKKQVWEYCLLITNPDMDPDRQVDQISQIWSRAEADEQLMEWLEFIDYFYTDVEEDDLPTSAKRAYLSEYLIERVGLPTKDDSFYGPRVLECPNGKGFVVVPRSSREPYDSANFKQQCCKNCGFEYGQHRPASQPTPPPED